MSDPREDERHSGVDYAPHRRGQNGRVAGAVARARERSVVRVYRGASFTLGHTTTRVTEPAARAVFLGSYLAWRSKRRIVQANAAHVLGLPAHDPAVRALARRTYASYSRFALELMRLPSRPADEPLRLLPPVGPAHEAFEALWERCQAEGRGIIAVSRAHRQHRDLRGLVRAPGAAHLGPRRRHRVPGAVRAAQPPARPLGRGHHPLAQPAGDLPGAARTPAALGMVVDWGYRPDDVPVRLFGAWTTLPAGPATLAARTRAVILPVAAYHGQPDGRYRACHGATASRSPTPSPRSIAIATQAIADALESFVRAAPEQWHTFKPMWPATRGRGAPPRGAGDGDARRRRASQVPGPRGVTGATTSDGGVDGIAAGSAARLLLLGVAVLQRLPDRPVYRLGFRAGRIASRFMRGRRALVRANLARVCGALDAHGSRHAPRERGRPRRPGPRRPGPRRVRPLVGDLPREAPSRPATTRPPCAVASSSPTRSWPRQPSRPFAPASPGPHLRGPAPRRGRAGAAVRGAHRVDARRGAHGAGRATRSSRTTSCGRGVPWASSLHPHPRRVGRAARPHPAGRGGRAGRRSSHRRCRDAASSCSARPAGCPAGPAVLAVETGAPLYVLAVLPGRLGRLGGLHRAHRGARDGQPPRAGRGRRSTGRSPRSSGSSHAHPSSGGRCCSASGRTSRRHDRGRRSGDRRTRAGRPRLPWPTGRRALRRPPIGP